MSAPDGPAFTVALIHDDHLHGASWLARQAAQGLADASSEPGATLEATHSLARELALARPSMATIANTVAAIWLAAATGASDETARLAALRAEAQVIEARWQGAVAGLTEWTRRRLSEANGAIYTLSRSGTVEGVLTALARERARHDPLAVIVSESRPGGEGVELARALALAGARVTLAQDSACAALIAEAALVVVGADAILADGSFVNKVGTRALALVAREAGIPVYALAERLKVTPSAYPLTLTEEAPESILVTPLAGVVERRPLFERTPAGLVTEVITEDGPLSAAELTRLAERAALAYSALMRS